MVDNTSTTQAGEEWFGFRCANVNCQMPLLAGKILPGMRDQNGGIVIGSHNQSRRAKCPHCQTESVYRTEQLEAFLVVEKHKLS